MIQNHGTGLLSQGTADWTDYRAEAALTPHLATSAGLAVRVQGLRRYYALLLHRDGTARLVRVCDGEEILAERPFSWHFGETYDCAIEVSGQRLRACREVVAHHPIRRGNVRDRGNKEEARAVDLAP